MDKINEDFRLKYLKNYRGKGIEVTDSEILKASVQLSNTTGLFAEPAAAQI